MLHGDGMAIVQNLIPCCVLALFMRRRERQWLSFLAILLFTTAFPPFSYLTSVVCYTPLIRLWRDRSVALAPWRLMAEGLLVGFTMAWVATDFTRAVLREDGIFIHAIGSVLYGMQVLLVAIATRFTRELPVYGAAPFVAGAAVLGEYGESFSGIVWCVTNLAVTVADTPLAQWSEWITPFGVSGFVYLINVLWIPESVALCGRKSGISWLVSPVLALTCLVGAWRGGEQLAEHVSVRPLPCTILLVQPHLISTDSEAFRPWQRLDPLTRAALQEHPDADLVVWPETSLSESRWPDARGTLHSSDERLTLHTFIQTMIPIYQTPSLVGSVIADVGVTQKYGLEVTDIRRYNCACLISPQGEMERHEKLELVPFREALPEFLVSGWLQGFLGLMGTKSPGLSMGRNYHPLQFTDKGGHQRTIAVAVCYESLLPWLPQYRLSPDVDAIIHLVYDGEFSESSGVMQRHLRACQLRAIETRKWNLVCSTCRGSAIIDPVGQIVRELPPRPGVLPVGTTLKRSRQ